MLANPSFELPADGGATPAGWSTFGVTGTSPIGTHGVWSARVSSPESGAFGVSAYWQPLAAEPGDRWSATAYVWHATDHPLGGQSRALLNLEWRDDADELISYESFTVADLTTPSDVPVRAEVESAPAPAGTVTMHLLLGVIQGPGDPPADVFFDEVVVERLGGPTPEELQWMDFPGGRSLVFADRDWRVKGPGTYGPGPNVFGDGEECVWADADGRLHLTVRDVDETWVCTEIALEESLGYGDYVFTTRGRLDLLDPAVVLGLFLWQYAPCYEPANAWWNPYNEIDVELGRWGDPANEIGQFVVQPWGEPGNLQRFDASFADDELASHAFRWLPDRADFRSWRGGPQDEATSEPIYAWSYAGPHLPRPDRVRVHLNLWLSAGAPSEQQEVVVDTFTFTPAADVPVFVPPAGTVALEHLSWATPNPFPSTTTIRYRVTVATAVALDVYDISGRHVRSLVADVLAPGEHAASWDGRSESFRRAASGVYIYRLAVGARTQTGRLLLLR